MSYVKKTTGGGQIDPPPAGIGLTKKLFPGEYKFHIVVKNLENPKNRFSKTNLQSYNNVFNFFFVFHDIWRPLYEIILQ